MGRTLVSLVCLSVIISQTNNSLTNNSLTNNNQFNNSLTCSEYQFACSDGNKCVDKTWLCDGDNDCGDWSDEEMYWCYNCTGPSLFTCSHGNKCVPQSYLCDGMPDCFPDYSDEAMSVCNNCTDLYWTSPL